MSKAKVFLKNTVTFLLLAASFFFIYRFATGTFDKKETPKYESSQTSESESNTPSDVTFEESDAELSPLGKFLKASPKSSENGTVTDTFNADTMHLTVSDTTGLGVTREFSLSNKTVNVPERIPHEIFGTYTTVINPVEEPRVQIELYDGNAIVDRGGKLELYSADGVKISDDFTLTPTYRRDDKGNALYTDGTSYFVIIDNKITASDYQSNADTRIIDYENTADFASDTSGNYFANDAENGNELYAVFNSAGERLTDYEYVKLYGYSEGLAAAVLEDGSISYLDTNGNVVFEGLISYRSMSDRYVHRIYCAPDTMGSESVGFIYFDEGLVMTRQKIADYVYMENIISDSFAVLKTDGKKLDLPDDYTPVSSADGVVVAGKDGYYGVFSKDETWVLHPRYDSIEPYYEGLAVVGDDEKYGVYDTKGNEILPLLFDYISPVSGGKIATYSEEFGFVIFEKQLISA